MNMMKRAGAILLAGLAITIFAGCGQQGDSPKGPNGGGEAVTYTEKSKLTEFTEHGVTVTVVLESDSKGQTVLRATFTPEKGFHLYDKDMPATGVKGLGRPTQLELAPHPDIKVSGAAFTESVAKNQEFKALNVTLPIYPDGPVTLRLPIQIAAGTGDVTALATLGYMACNEETCRNPVTKKVELKIPRG